MLFYIKVYPTYSFWWWVFDVVKSRSFTWVHQYLPILKKALKYKVVFPERQVNNLEDLLKRCPEIKELFVDGTERPVNRTKKTKQQKRNYSGKKKRHTIKNTIVSDRRRRIHFLWKTQEWKLHDKKLYDKDGSSEIHCEKWWDTWYIWWSWIHIPKKKQKWKILTQAEKESNKIISSFRVVVENAIAGIKRFWIVSQKFRWRIYGNFQTVKRDTKDLVMAITVGLHNLTVW